MKVLVCCKCLKIFLTFSKNCWQLDKVDWEENWFFNISPLKIRNWINEVSLELFDSETALLSFELDIEFF